MLTNKLVVVLSVGVLAGCSRNDLAQFEEGKVANIIPISASGEIIMGPHVVNDSYAPVEESPKSNQYEAPIKMVEQPPEEVKELTPPEEEDDQPKVPVVKTVKPRTDLVQPEIKPEAMPKKAAAKSTTLVDGGKIVTKFGAIVDGYKSDGMIIKAPLGNTVRPIKDGTVIYAGNKLKEYGNIVVVKHDNDLISTYAHLQKIMVNKDDAVTASTNIGTVGKTGDAKFPQVYLQLMKDSVTIDPAKYVKLK